MVSSLISSYRRSLLQGARWKQSFPLNISKHNIKLSEYMHTFRKHETEVFKLTVIHPSKQGYIILILKYGAAVNKGTNVWAAHICSRSYT
jgi:hypothetical protein